MRVILDTNVWSEIGRRDSLGRIERAAMSKAWQIQTPPATLLEVMRTSDPIARSKIVGVLSSPSWKRLPSEAESEANEFVSEARRLRPDWLRQIPNTGRASTYRTYWTKTVWREARQNPEKFAAASAEIHDPVDRYVAGIAKDNRRFVVEQAPKLRDIDRWVEVGSDSLYVAFSNSPERARRVEAWRYKTREVFWHALRTYSLKRIMGSGDTYVDWLEPYLLPDKVRADFRDFSDFWFDEVDGSRMPRLWLRGAVENAQLLEKVTSSVGRDEQLCSYLPDCDLFVSNDRRLLVALEVVAQACSFTLPEFVFFPNLNVDDSAVEQLVEIC